ncbi:glycosyltransferase [Patescibacteria group bacterium]|nr:glycosyltransferase [Patescibacteria group bacterium]
MKVLSIGSDGKLFSRGSAVRSRIIEYGKCVEELHVVVFTLKILKLREEQISKNVWLYPTNSLSRFLYIGSAIRVGKRLFNIGALNEKDTLITSQDPFESGLVAVRLSQQWRVPFQIQIHTDFLNPYFTRGSLLNKIRVLIAEMVLPHANCVRVVSKRIATSVNKRYTLKSTPKILPIYEEKKKVGGGMDLKKEYPMFDFIVLMNSRLEREKNIPLAFSSLKIALEKNSKIGLIIAGSGREKESLKKRVMELGLRDNVVFIGWQENVASLYKSADLYLHTGRYEGYGLTFIEAALEHCPILSTQIGIIGDVLDTNYVLTCAQEDPKCFGDQIIRAYEHPETQKNNAEQAEKAAREHLPKDKETYLEEYGTLWRECSKG